MQIKLNPKATEELNQLAAAMAHLADGVQDYLYGEMTIAAARRFAKHAKGSPRFKDQSGAMRKSIRAVRIDVEGAKGREIKGGGARALMGGKKAPHAHLIEFGTSQRRQSSTGRATGRVKARNIMGQAFDTQKDEAMRDAMNAGRKKFAKLVKVARGKGKLTKREVKAISV